MESRGKSTVLGLREHRLEIPHLGGAEGQRAVGAGAVAQRVVSNQAQAELLAGLPRTRQRTVSGMPQWPLEPWSMKSVPQAACGLCSPTPRCARRPARGRRTRKLPAGTTIQAAGWECSAGRDARIIGGKAENSKPYALEFSAVRRLRHLRLLEAETSEGFFDPLFA